MNLKRTIDKITDWEQWHYHFKYIPLYPVWFWFCLKARSLWFFTASNPTITFGGFEGEGKKEMYLQLPPSSYPTTVFIAAGEPFDLIEQKMFEKGMRYPIAVKPEVGMMGFLFRRINNPEGLHFYHSHMPVDYLIQELVDFPLEVSVFYYRFPNQQKGVITGFLKKELLEVTGDGRSTLNELMAQFEKRPGFKPAEWKVKHAERLHEVIPAGEVYRLSWVANLSRGGKLVNLDHEKDARLLAVFDSLSHQTGQFYYGRYDVKCKSVEALKNGEDFTILEFNGSGAEPHHIYGNGNSLFQAYRIVISHWKVLYQISKYNHAQGVEYWPFMKGVSFLKQAKKHFKLLRQLDLQMP